MKSFLLILLFGAWATSASAQAASNIRTDDATREEAARRLRKAEENLRKAYGLPPN